MAEKGPRGGRFEKPVHPIIIQPTEVEQTSEGNKIHVDVSGCPEAVDRFLDDMRNIPNVIVDDNPPSSSRKSVSMSGNWKGSDWKPESPFFRRLHGDPQKN